MNFVVANLMYQDRRPAPAASKFWDQVVKALLCLRWDRPQAERANGIVLGQAASSTNVPRRRAQFDAKRKAPFESDPNDCARDI